MKLIIHTICFIPPLRFWRALSSHVSKIDQTESAIHISGCTLEDSFQGREVIKKNWFNYHTNFNKLEKMRYK